MKIITYELITDIKIPNITIEKKIVDGEHTAYKLTANEEYVLYDTTENEEILDPETNIMKVVKNYYRYAVIPVRYAPEIWPWEAVLESEVSETDRIN